MNRHLRLIWVFIAFIFACVIGFAASAQPTSGTDPVSAASTGSGVENSVVKIFSTVRYPDPYKPWSKQSPTDVVGTGVVIKGKRILTNAHVVGYASQVQIQANQAGDKLSATVEYIAPGIDLAVLKLDDESFFDTHPALTESKSLPQIKDGVMAYGFPEGGTSLSITRGIVSRIEFTGYNNGVSGLRIQIDAAINPGNSGGPAVVGDKLIGLVFSRLGGADNIGYIIPTEEIDMFLNDIADGHYDGKPAIYEEFQTLENPALRSFLKLDKSVTGMVVHRPYSDAADYPLKTWDVITHIGDMPVDDQGMIRLGDDLRVRFTYLVQKIAKDGKVPMTIVRNGREMKVQVPALKTHPEVVPDLDNQYPSYFICGPMVFTAASKEFLRYLMAGDRNGFRTLVLSYTGSPLLSRMTDKPAFDGEQLVVVASPFFPNRLAKGYTDPYCKVLKTINGIPVKNLNHLVQILRDLKDDFITVEFNGKDAETLIFPRKEMIAATDEILTDNGIRSQGSSDAMAIWSAKPQR
jgi:S1-C subfamily serine protease